MGQACCDGGSPAGRLPDVAAAPVQPPVHQAVGRGGGCGCGRSHAGLALTSLAPGELGQVCETCMDPADAAMVRAMGLRPNAMVRVCRQGDPTIIEVFSGNGATTEGPGMCSRPDCRCRLGLARVLAERVRVTLGPGRP